MRDTERGEKEAKGDISQHFNVSTGNPGAVRV